MSSPFESEGFPERKANLKALKAMGACAEAMLYVSGMPSWEEAWRQCTVGSWMNWYMRAKGYVEFEEASERRKALDESQKVAGGVEKDEKCTCGCGKGISWSSEAEAKLANSFREYYKVTPTAPSELVRLYRFQIYHRLPIDYTST